MKKILLMFLMTVLVVFCAGAEGIREISTGQGIRTVMDFSEITGQEWKLIEVHIDGLITQFRRSSLPREMDNCFSINFDRNTASGVGAPNRYSAPYADGEDYTIRIMMVRSTRMASLFEISSLKENDFFIYVQNSYHWNVIGGQFELHSKSASGREVRLVFSL